MEKVIQDTGAETAEVRQDTGAEVEMSEKEKLDLIAEASKHGKMVLSAPIKASGKDVGELVFDFTKITGLEFVEIMDKNSPGKIDAFGITDTQAIALFAAAAAKMTPGVDEYDIPPRLSIEDTIKAVQIAALFFKSVSRQGDARISKS